jgi:hypothetical protein
VTVNSGLGLSGSTKHVTFLPGNSYIAFGLEETPSIKIVDPTTCATILSLTPYIDGAALIYQQGIMPSTGYLWIITLDDSYQMWDPA